MRTMCAVLASALLLWMTSVFGAQPDAPVANSSQPWTFEKCVPVCNSRFGVDPSFVAAALTASEWLQYCECWCHRYTSTLTPEWLKSWDGVPNSGERGRAAIRTVREEARTSCTNTLVEGMTAERALLVRQATLPVGPVRQPVVIHSVPSLYEQRVAALLKNRMFLKAERPLKVLTQIEWRTPTGASSSSHRVIHAAGLDRWDGAYKRLLSFYTLPQDTYGQVPEHVAVLIRDTDLSSTERELLLREAEVSFRVTRNPTAEIREAALATKSTGSIITALPLMVELPGLPKDYARRLSAIVRNQLSYAGTLSEGHIAGVEADMLADGRIVHVVLTETSGDHEWDEAVLRAVVKTEFLPRGEDGLVPERAYFRFVQK